MALSGSPILLVDQPAQREFGAFFDRLLPAFHASDRGAGHVQQFAELGLRQIQRLAQVAEFGGRHYSHRGRHRDGLAFSSSAACLRAGDCPVTYVSSMSTKCPHGSCTVRTGATS